MLPAILDAEGNVVVSYVYDAWGQPIGKAGTLASTLGTLNPFRYRGYVYDEDTELYYLRSRYYFLNWYRFLNSDVMIFTGNLYAYCDNNPTNFCDAHGLEKDSVDGLNPSATRFWYYAIHYNHGKYVSGEGYVPHIHLVDKQTGVEYAINADKTPHDSKRCKYPDEKAMEVLEKDKKIRKKWPPSDGPKSGGTGYSAFWPSSDSDSVADSGHAFNTIAIGALMQSQISGSASTYVSYTHGASAYSFGYASPQYATSAESPLQGVYWQAEAAVTGFFGFLDDKLTECYWDDMGVPAF